MFEITQKGIPELNRKMRQFERAVQRPDHSYSIKRMGREWNRNYRGEGSAVGGWAELSPYTQRIRKQRGFRGKHPILVQTGRLRDLTITALINANRPFRANRKGISVAVAYNGLVATLNASGEKAQNQTGGKNTVGITPARPFWYADGAVTDAATAGLDQWVRKMLRDYR